MHPFVGVESWVNGAVQWLRLGVETLGAATIGAGVLVAVWQMLRAPFQGKRSADFTAIRLLLARYLALALEFQLAADILSTAIAPGWQEIGKLGAIAVIRTALNFFLSRETQEEHATVRGEQAVKREGA